MRRQHQPVSSYRFQFHGRFGFSDAERLVPYLEALGVTDCYSSPLLQATAGSEHGYDICNHNALNPELGSDADFNRLAAALRARGMGLIVDFVPNHMGLDVNANQWWRDVLQRGEASPFAEFFDIDWTPLTRELRGRVLLPILEDHYGEVLHRGEIHLEAEPDGPVVRYYERRLPVNPATWAPFADEGPVEDVVRTLNGVPGEPQTFDRLDVLLEQQAYRLAYWKTSLDEINYRRFFDINQLGAIRMELPAVFEATHRKLLSLIARGQVTGLRLDHPDGLLDPAAYFARLQDAILRLPGEGDAATRFHVVVEKILGRGELMPSSWPVSGTTGYGFLNDVNGLFVDQANEPAFRSLYARVALRRDSYDEVAYRSRLLVTRSSMASELAVLAERLKEIAEMDRRTRDHTLTALRRALAEVVACMPVYRTYITEEGFAATDRETIDSAIDRARRSNPVMAPSVFLFLRSVLLADSGLQAEALRLHRHFAMRFQQFSAPIQAKGIEDTAFYRYNALISLNEVGGDPSRFGTSVDEFHAGCRVRAERWRDEMTATATHDTKRGEDTRARLNVLSELPLEWRRAVMQWRRINAIRRTAVDRAPAPDGNDEYLFYQALLGAWPLEPADAAVPHEAPADLVDRLKAFMLKAIRESKTHTSWLNQNRAYEDAVGLFVESSLRGSGAKRFMAAFVPVARRIAAAGVINSLAQLLLKVGTPGVPDFYQGTELWQFDFADPDNRRPIDYTRRERLLGDMQQWIARSESAAAGAAADPAPLRDFVAGIAAQPEDARIKLFVTAVALRLRRSWPAVFIEGEYEPLRVEGPAAAHVVAFARRHGARAAIIAVPRLTTTLTRAAGSAADPWQDTSLVLGSQSSRRTFINAFTGDRLAPDAERLPISLLFGACPVALLATTPEAPV